MANNAKEKEKKSSTQWAICLKLKWVCFGSAFVCFAFAFWIYVSNWVLRAQMFKKKWISKLRAVLTESLFKSSQSHFCWEITSTQLITIQIYFWHKDCLSLAIILASIITVCETLPPKINCNNTLPRGLSPVPGLYNPSQSDSCLSDLLYDNTPNITNFNICDKPTS